MTTCSKSEYAARKGVSKPSITHAISRGRVVLTADGRVDVEASDKAWAEKTDALQSARVNAPKRRAAALADDADRAASGQAVPPAPLERVIYDFESARAKRETHAANIAEMEERKRAGELCEVSAVMMVMSRIGTNFSTALERVADKIADRVAAESDPHACHQIIWSEISQALEHLSKDCEASGGDLARGGDGRA